MKLEEYFQLTLEDRITLAEKSTINKRKATIPYTIETYYETSDSISLLEKLRAYQLNHIMSRMAILKYKLF